MNGELDELEFEEDDGHRLDDEIDEMLSE